MADCDTWSLRPQAVNDPVSAIACRISSCRRSIRYRPWNGYIPDVSAFLVDAVRKRAQEQRDMIVLVRVAHDEGDFHLGKKRRRHATLAMVGRDIERQPVRPGRGRPAFGQRRAPFTVG